jgi:hypothetical protein
MHSELPCFLLLNSGVFWSHVKSAKWGPYNRWSSGLHTLDMIPGWIFMYYGKPNPGPLLCWVSVGRVPELPCSKDITKHKNQDNFFLWHWVSQEKMTQPIEKNGCPHNFTLCKHTSKYTKKNTLRGFCDCRQDPWAHYVGQGDRPRPLRVSEVMHNLHNGPRVRPFHDIKV